MRVVADYAPVKGKRSLCYLTKCGQVIERGHLRIKEEYPYAVDGTEAQHRYHIECYPFSIPMAKLEGLDKLKEEDKRKVISKTDQSGSTHTTTVSANETADSENEEGAEKTKEKDNGEYGEGEKEEEEEEKDGEEDKEGEEKGDKEGEEKGEEKGEEEKKKGGGKGPVGKYRNGSKVMAKFQGNIARNIWFSAKVISTRLSALKLPEYHVIYLEDTAKDVKEWVPERFVGPPLSDENPPLSAITAGILALGWRRKPGAANSLGWWYSVKILRFLADVPGAYVHWADFPFPDSILETGQLHLIQPKVEVKTNDVSPQKGTKRPVENEDDVVTKKEKLT